MCIDRHVHIYSKVQSELLIEEKQIGEYICNCPRRCQFKSENLQNSTFIMDI